MPDTPLQIAVLISGGGTTLINLHRCIEQGELPARIVCVICSNASAKGIERARHIGLDVAVIRPKDYADRNEYAEAIWRTIRESGAQLVCMAGFLTLLPIAEDYRGRVMNIHPALLPDFGGRGMYGHHVHEAVLAAGRRQSGCTVHFADDRYDHGPIILQRTCPVEPNDTPDTLAARVFEQECLAYPQAIRLFAEGKIELQRYSS